ncbi:uncharacterized protein DUF4263 [Amycolatopsis thermoflava]|uniref:Uncharacterized protein DUF4263 n=2 Tax=Amycolatopsis thermoflava TaxID=84480 RepID=A0A3N2GQP5_9PSEU|nr:uncharacterized protein DUF4263 [Amycolatopsis thermoflava]
MASTTGRFVACGQSVTAAASGPIFVTMSSRADWSLELQLEATQKEAVHPDVQNAIAQAIVYMHSGKSRRRRGGRALVERLEVARLRASEENEWHVVRLLQDALDYATGRILNPDFEERYRLFQDGGRSDHRRDFVSGVFFGMQEFVRGASRKFLEDNESASAQELLAHLTSVVADGKFLDAPEDRPGRYRLVRGRAELALWLERVLRDRIDIEDPSAKVGNLVRTPAVLELLAGDVDGQSILLAAEMKRRAESVTQIRAICESDLATERDLQRVLEKQAWIFGGRFVGAVGRRRLVPGDEVDIPLVRGDGSLQIVELKRSRAIRAIVKRHRGSLVPTSEVHDAVAQAVNYLVGLDENRSRIREEFGIETRRASALVLIGHPACHSDVPEGEVNETLRTLNSHLNRVEVMTYKELVDNASRSLTEAPLY